MPLDKTSYPILIDKILKSFCNVFGKDMLLTNKQEATDHMGYFKIQYKYIPLQYDIIFESDRDVFCIDIYDDEGAKNSLYRIEKIDNETTIVNVEYAIKRLKSVLKKNDFYFYISRGEKLYRKENNQYKKVNDMTEFEGVKYW